MIQLNPNQDWRITTFCKSEKISFPMKCQAYPSKRYRYFPIELVPRAAPEYKAPYCMSTLELIELKMRLQDLLDKGYIIPSMSSWGAPVLFVKKKDGTLRLYIDYR